MSELIGLLGTLSALLTLTGVYRFTGFFFNRGAGLAALLAVAATAVFLLLFEWIVLLAGLLTLASPVVAALYWNKVSTLPAGVPKLPFGIGADDASSANGGGGSPAGGKNTGSTPGSNRRSTGGSDDAPNECHNCGEHNGADAAFCEECGWRLDA